MLHYVHRNRSLIRDGSPRTATSTLLLMLLKCCFTSTETVGLLGTGRRVGRGVWRWGKKEIIYLSLHCHHQNDSCIKMGSDESHFNVS